MVQSRPRSSNLTRIGWRTSGSAAYEVHRQAVGRAPSRAGGDGRGIALRPGPGGEHDESAVVDRGGQGLRARRGDRPRGPRPCPIRRRWCRPGCPRPPARRGRACSSAPGPIAASAGESGPSRRRPPPGSPSSRPRSFRSIRSADRAWSKVGQEVVLHVVAVDVRVPAVAVAGVVVDGHEPHARLDQPAGHQGRLAEQVAPVAVADPRRLAADVQRPAGRLRGRRAPGRGGGNWSKSRWPHVRSRARRPASNCSRSEARRFVRSSRRPVAGGRAPRSRMSARRRRSRASRGCRLGPSCPRRWSGDCIGGRASRRARPGGGTAGLLESPQRIGHDGVGGQVARTPPAGPCWARYSTTDPIAGQSCGRRVEPPPIGTCQILPGLHVVGGAAVVVERVRHASARRRTCRRSPPAGAGARRSAGPGVREAMGRNGPRIFSGASGFRSKVSSWLGPPNRKRKITERARGRARRPPWASARRSTGEAQAEQAGPRPPPARSAA